MIACALHCLGCKSGSSRRGSGSTPSAGYDYAAVKVRRDAAAEQLRERYLTIVAELVALMADIAATDKEVDRINVAAPYGDYPRLRGVELTARGLDRLLQPNISIVQELRLPCFDRAPDMPLWRIRCRCRTWRCRC